MGAEKLIAEARQAGIRLRLEQGRLRIEYGRGQETLARKLMERKAEVVAALLRHRVAETHPGDKLDKLDKFGPTACGADLHPDDAARFGDRLNPAGSGAAEPEPDPPLDRLLSELEAAGAPIPELFKCPGCGAARQAAPRAGAACCSWSARSATGRPGPLRREAPNTLRVSS
jgi:hypothetical protein